MDPKFLNFQISYARSCILQLLGQCPQSELMWTPLPSVPTEHQALLSLALSSVHPLYTTPLKMKGKMHPWPLFAPDSVTQMLVPSDGLTKKLRIQFQLDIICKKHIQCHAENLIFILKPFKVLFLILKKISVGSR